jgi:hypothetical protein
VFSSWHAEHRLSFERAVDAVVHGELGDPPGFAGVCLDRMQILLCEGGQGGPGTWMMVWVDDVDAYHASLSLEKARVLEGPVGRSGRGGAHRQRLTAAGRNDCSEPWPRP